MTQHRNASDLPSQAGAGAPRFTRLHATNGWECAIGRQQVQDNHCCIVLEPAICTPYCRHHALRNYLFHAF